MDRFDVYMHPPCQARAPRVLSHLLQQVDNYEYELPSEFEDEEIDEELAFTAEDKKKYAAWFDKELSGGEEEGAEGADYTDEDGDPGAGWGEEDEDSSDAQAADDDPIVGLHSNDDDDDDLLVGDAGDDDEEGGRDEDFDEDHHRHAALPATGGG